MGGKKRGKYKTPKNPSKTSGPQGDKTKKPSPSKQFGEGQKQPHTDGTGQSGQPRQGS